MPTKVPSQQLIVGEYKILGIIREDAVYRWVRTTDPQTDRSLLLQILSPGLSPAAVDACRQYFRSLREISRPGVLVPERIRYDTTYPLVLIYPDAGAEPLSLALQKQPDRLAGWLHQVCEAFHAVHNEMLHHGRVAPDSFVLKEGSVWLTGFGYAPLIELGINGATGPDRQFTAPEVISKQQVSRASDLYGLARTVVAWEPALEATDFYRKATAEQPEDRFQRARLEFWPAVDHALASLRVDQTETTEGRGDYAGSEREGESAADRGAGGIVPVYRLRARAEPPRAGSAEGGGEYRSEELITIRAIAREGWLFDHWAGSWSGMGDAATFAMGEGDREVVAVFRATQAENVPDISVGQHQPPRHPHRSISLLLLAAALFAGITTPARITAVHLIRSLHDLVAPPPPPPPLPPTAKQLAQDAERRIGRAEGAIQRYVASPPPSSEDAKKWQEVLDICAQAERSAGAAIHVDRNYPNGYVCRVQALRLMQQYDAAFAASEPESNGFPGEAGIQREIGMLECLRLPFVRRPKALPPWRAKRLADKAGKLLNELDERYQWYGVHPPLKRDLPRIREQLRAKCIQSLEVARSAMWADPSYPQGYVCAVQALRIMQRYGDASELAAKAEQLFPDNLDIRWEIQYLRQKKKYARRL